MSPRFSLQIVTSKEVLFIALAHSLSREHISASHMYRSLTPEEKSRWDTHAAQDKARYENEMANYTPAPGYDATGTLISTIQPGPRKYNKKNKDPDAPKRARGSFVYFTFECRPQIMKEQPGIKFTELGTAMGERWRALTPDEKKKYEDLAEEDKKRFDDEMQEYNANRAASQPDPPEKEYAVNSYTYQGESQQQMYDPHAHYYQQQHYAQDPNVAAAQHAQQYAEYYAHAQQGYQYPHQEEQGHHHYA